MPNDIDDKTGGLVSETIASKHPDGKDVDITNLPAYEECAELIEIQVSDEIVEQASRNLSGGAGLTGLDSSSLTHWLLKHGGASMILRKAVAKMVEWLANSHPPWAAHRALTWNRLIGLDKCPGVRPIGSGDIFRRTFCKCLLAVTKSEATRACGIDQLCGGLEAGMEGATHHV